MKYHMFFLKKKLKYLYISISLLWATGLPLPQIKPTQNCIQPAGIVPWYNKFDKIDKRELIYI